jgi:hypothetical protein
MESTEINCPYCGAANEVEMIESTCIFPHPLIETKTNMDDNILYSEKKHDKQYSCIICGETIVVTYLPNFSRSRISDELRYYTRLLNSRNPNTDNRLFVEKIIDCVFSFKIIWCIFSILSILSVFLYFYPRLFPFNNPQLSEVLPIFAYLLSSIFLIYFSKFFFPRLRMLASSEYLGVKLTKNYIKTNYCMAYEEWQIKSQIFSPPYSKISHATMQGLLCVGMYLLIKFGVFVSLFGNIYARTNFIPMPFTNNPVILYSMSDFLVWSEIFSLPYGILVWFIFGNLLSIAFAAIANIELLSLKCKFSEKILCDDETNSSIPKIWFYSVGIIAIMFFLITIVMYWASIASDAFAHMRTDPFSNIMGFISVISLFVIFTWILVSPIIRYRTKLIDMIRKCQKNLKERLIYIENLTFHTKSDVINYCKLSNRMIRINSISEWQIIFGKHGYKNYLIVISILTATGFITRIIPTVAFDIFQIIVKTFFSWL